jgi:hypothetical protein
MLTSRSYQLDKNDVIALVKNAVLVGLAALLTYVGQNVTKLDLGPSVALFVPVIAMMLDSAVKWVKNNVKE